MASVKFSAMISEIKGKLNGSIFSVGYGGQTIRNRHSGGGRKTGRWQIVKSNLSFVASQWRGLSVAQQEQWNSAASQYPYINKFGDPIQPSGFQLHSTLNSNLLVINQPLLSVPLSPPQQESIGTVNLTQTQSRNLPFNYTPTQNGDSNIVVFASPVLSAGVTSLPRLSRLLGNVQSSDASPFSLTPLYDTAYGRLPQVGRVFVKWHQVDRATGFAYGFNFLIADLV